MYDLNFQECVHQSVAHRIGCLSPWAPPSAQTALNNIELNECNSTAEVDEYGKVYGKTLSLSQQAMEDLTGCKFPCNFQHFSLVGNFRAQVDDLNSKACLMLLTHYISDRLQDQLHDPVICLDRYLCGGGEADLPS